MPEGPIAFDGTSFRYSKGERKYIDELAVGFKEVHIAAFVIRSGEPFYESLLHSTFEADNLIFHELPSSGGTTPSVFGKVIQFSRVFVKLVRVTKNTDLSYLFLPSYPSALGWAAAKVWRKPHIVYGADDWRQASESMFKWPHLKEGLFYRAYCLLNKFLERKVVSTALFGVAAGGQLVEKYSNLGTITYPTSPRITLTPDDIRDRTDTCQNDTIEVVTVAALIHDKALHILIQAFAKLSFSSKPIKLSIVGDGPLLEELVQLTSTLGVSDRVNFVGYVEEEAELYNLLRRADVFALSSVTEGFPRVFYEAIAARLPIVSTDVGGIPRTLKNREDAMLVRCNDVTGFASALEEVMADSALRKRLISNSGIVLDTVFKSIDGGQISKILADRFE